MATQPVRVPDEVHEEVQNAARLLGCTSGELLARAWLAFRQSPEFREEFAFFQKAFSAGDLDAVTEHLRRLGVTRASDRATAGRAERGSDGMKPRALLARLARGELANVSFPDAERLAEALGFTLDRVAGDTTSTGILT